MKKHFFTAFFLFFAAGLLFQTSIVWAYPWLSPLLEEPTNRVEIFSEGFYYYKKPRPKAYFQFGSNFSYYNQKIDLDLGLDYSYSEKKLYPNPKALAVFFPSFSEKWRMGFGIKKRLWSLTDSYWNHGLWQARYKVDAFRPQPIGFPGLYFEYEGDISFLFLASYFYIPNISYRLEEGKIESKNPFFPKSLIDNDKFELQLPKDWSPVTIKESLFHPVLAFQIKHSFDKASLSVSYAYKPLNDFRSSVEINQTQTINLDEASKRLSSSAQSSSPKWTVTDLNFYLLPHHLAGLEGWASIGQDLFLSASLFYDYPINKKEEGDWNLLSNSKMIASLLAYFKKDRENYQTLLSFGWTKIQEAPPQKKKNANIYEKELESIFGLGFMWKEALSMGGEYKLKKMFEDMDMDLSMRAVYALDNHFFSLVSTGKLQLPSHFQFWLSGDLIFRLLPKSYNKKTSLIHKYKDLSRLSMGLKYVF